MGDWSDTRLVMVGVVGVISDTLLGVFVVNENNDDSAVEPPAPPTPTVAASPGGGVTAYESGFPGAPTRINELGIPVGYPRTEVGAVSAWGPEMAFNIEVWVPIYARCSGLTTIGDRLEQATAPRARRSSTGVLKPSSDSSFWGQRRER